MDTNIKVINLGMVNTYVIQGKQTILVDTGMKGNDKKILKALHAMGLHPQDIKLIVLTHCHEDHIGSLDALVEATGAQVLIDSLEYDTWCGNEPADIEPLNFIVKKMMDRASKKEVEVHVPHVDIKMTETFDLSDFGINGKVYRTPGHSKGSISILLDNGSCFIGDQLMAMMPFSKPKKPFLAYSLDEIKKSIKGLVNLGATTFYLSHGKCYSKEKVLKTLNTF